MTAEEKKMYEMPLHSYVKVDDFNGTMRVIGGWIYFSYEDVQQGSITNTVLKCTCFVPEKQ